MNNNRDNKNNGNDDRDGLHRLCSNKPCVKKASFPCPTCTTTFYCGVSCYFEHRDQHSNFCAGLVDDVNDDHDDDKVEGKYTLYSLIYYLYIISI